MSIRAAKNVAVVVTMSASCFLVKTVGFKVMINTLFCGVVHNATSEAVFAKCSTVKNGKFLHTGIAALCHSKTFFRLLKKLRNCI